MKGTGFKLFWILLKNVIDIDDNYGRMIMWRAEKPRRYRPLNDYPSLWVLVQKTTYRVQVPATIAAQTTGDALRSVL